MASLELLSPGGYRKDGRRLDQHRKVEIDIGESNEGVTYKCGTTVVTARVMEDEFTSASTTCLTVTLTWAPFAFPERRLRKADRITATYERAIKESFEPVLHNKSNPLVSVHVQLTVMSADGGLLAACTNATTLALSRSGYALDDLIVACCVAESDKTIFIDPTHYELLKTDCDLTVACLSRTRDIALLLSECKINAGTLADLIKQATDSSINHVMPVLVQAQERHVKYITALRGLISDRLINGAR